MITIHFWGAPAIAREECQATLVRSIRIKSREPESTSRLPPPPNNRAGAGLLGPIFGPLWGELGCSVTSFSPSKAKLPFYQEKQVLCY